MRTNVIDLIIEMIRQVRAGQKLKDIDPKSFDGYNRAETSAAYSWILHKSDRDKISKEAGVIDARRNTRILHSAERLMLSTEAQGYLIELFNIGVIDNSDMENIIEHCMITSMEKIDLERMKEIVASLVFGTGEKSRPNSVFLRGNETIN
ncbi:MAG: DUF494 domain-containing protein [Candidatus Cyclonatronum sp.]|uniref:DUF494 family protein n=1 Tax=Cyclonatronum sp. TaxID=3024185 RepID=UPI0025BFC8C7|nr:DUF494 family protein [Cyclonatronum sp.]MCC5933990.1 DUF494 family protein [Balneolales bacterium]MCH8485589.1 DUF494 domain-containing protein [Cyclonatronum sp.]